MADDYFVAPNGSDKNPGTRELPFKTIDYARRHVSANPNRGKNPINVFLREGTYYLEKTLTFSAEDSGSAKAPITYSAFNKEKAVLSGGIRLNLDWKPFKDGIYQASTPAGIEIDQLFVNGKLQRMARYPNYNPDIYPYNGFSSGAFSRQRAERWKNPQGGYIHAMQKHRWGGFHYLITGKDEAGKVTYEGGWQNNRPTGMHHKFRFVENIFEELDVPGEWYHDEKAKTLYYMPAEGEDLSKATVEAAQLKHLIEFVGAEASPINFIDLKGLTFRHTLRTFMDTKEPLLRSDWAIYRGGAVVYTGAEDCVISDCEFDHVGGNGVFVSNYNRRISVRGTHIHGAGASAVCFVGSPKSVRDPLFNYKERNSFEAIDKTKGPKSPDYPSDCVVEDCLIHNIGIIEKQATGVQISMAGGITLRHCSIYDVGRAGINISEGTFGGHLIEFCDVFDTVRETGDHGSFNSWGRDRFWGLKDAPDEALPELALLDTERTVIRNSRWRCDHGWDVDLDDGSSNYEIYNNLFLRGGLKLREGFHRKVYNNIAVNSTFHPHVWYKGSGDVVTGNIWMGPYRPAIMKHWGKEIDKNMFVNEADRKRFLPMGCDKNSIVGDPMFVAPEIGDYSVGPKSPFLKFGFKNFPMDMFGVQRAELKKVAQVPRFPVPKQAGVGQDDTDQPTNVWLGATVATVAGEQFSAFGISKEDGGVHLVKVPPKSLVATVGLKADDVVQQINGRKVKTVERLLKLAGDRDKGPFAIQIVRGQSELTVTITR